jgi:hypothetical protein
VIENIKKTKKFVETPTVLSRIMHFYLSLKKEESLLDLTAGKGSLFLDHPVEKCYGCELDFGNYSILKQKGYKNIIYGDVFECEKQIEDESMDSIILNPPYGKLRNGKNSVDIMNLATKKLKKGGKFAIINQSNFIQNFQKESECLKQNLQVEIALLFSNELFKPFASVESLLICGIKTQKKIESVVVWIFENDKIKINKRSKNIEVKLLKPVEKVIKQKDFWEQIYKVNIKPATPPTLDDFKKTIIDYMAFESGMPRNMIENPELLGKALDYFRNFYRK